MNTTSDFSITFGADMSAFLQSLREMAQSITQVMNAMRGQIAAMNQGGEAAKRVTLYGADGMKAWEGATRDATGALKEQPKTLKDVSRNIREIVLRTQEANKGTSDMHGQITKTAKSLRERAGMFAEPFAQITVMAHGIRRFCGVLTGAVQAPLREFGRFEDAATRLAPLTGGMELATELCKDLRKEAANGTMSFEQLTSAAGRLASVFKDTRDVKKWTSAFHDLSAGTGLDVNELISNFVKSKASGRFEAGLMEMFAQKGINIFPELRSQTGKTEAELRKMATEGKLAFAEVEKAILAVSTGAGKYAGQAAKLSETWNGSVQTMIANWHILLAEIGKPVADALSPIIKKLSDFMQDNPKFVSALAEAGVWLGKLATPAVAVAVAINGINKAVGGVHKAFSGLFSFCSSGFKKMSSEAKAAGTSVASGNASGKKAIGGGATAAAAVAGLAFSAANLAIDAYFDPRIEAGERYLAFLKHFERVQERLNESLNPEEFDAAKKQYISMLNMLDERGNEMKKDAGMNPNEGINVETSRLVLQKIEERKKREFEKQAALEASKKKELELAEVERKRSEENEKAFENWKALTREIEKSRKEKALHEADVKKRASLFLEQNGIQDSTSLEKRITAAAKQLNADITNGNATQTQVEKYKELVELRDRYNVLCDEAKKTIEASTPKSVAASKPSEAPEKIGGGIWSRIGTERASIGGGRVLNLGFNQSLAVAREQLQVLKKIASSLDGEHSTTAAFA